MRVTVTASGRIQPLAWLYTVSLMMTQIRDEEHQRSRGGNRQTKEKSSASESLSRAKDLWYTRRDASSARRAIDKLLGDHPNSDEANEAFALLADIENYKPPKNESMVLKGLNIAGHLYLLASLVPVLIVLFIMFVLFIAPG